MNIDPPEIVQKEMLLLNGRKKWSKNQLAFRKHSCYINIHRAKERICQSIFLKKYFFDECVRRNPIPHSGGG